MLIHEKRGELAPLLQCGPVTAEMEAELDANPAGSMLQTTAPPPGSEPTGAMLQTNTEGSELGSMLQPGSTESEQGPLSLQISDVRSELGPVQPGELDQMSQSASTTPEPGPMLHPTTAGSDMLVIPQMLDD